MIASKYPILDVDFYSFKIKGGKIWMKLVDYGCVMAKLDLGKDKVNAGNRLLIMSSGCLETI